MQVIFEKSAVFEQINVDENQKTKTESAFWSVQKE
jgi:hypothetical protein